MNYLNNYNKMIERATSGELTNYDINEVLLLVNQKLEAYGGSLKSTKEMARAAIDGVEEIKKEYTLLPAMNSVERTLEKKGVLSFFVA